ncbi:MAG: sulfur transferase domain-containing protein [Vicinamibacterales bacterium]
MTKRIAMALALAVMTVPLFAQVQKAEREGIRNFSRVDATVACGGAVDPAALSGLKKDGYVSVINFRLASEEGANVEEERAAAQSAGLKYIYLPFNVAAPDSKVVDSFLAAVGDKSNQPVFIHCGSANRVGGMWMIKRVLKDGWTIDRAREEAQAIGLNSAPLTAFVTSYINAHR